MRLIGMMDSPYVRRVAVSLKLMELPFEHDQISVFRQYDAFAAINPVVKAPSFVTDDGVVLMESSLILDYLERIVPPERRLMPSELPEITRSLRITALALAACEKTVQIVYETTLRPQSARHQPWLDRIGAQMLTAYRLLDAEISNAQGWLTGKRPMQADIAAATAWRFTQHVIADRVDPDAFSNVAALSARAEQLPAFLSSPLE